MDFINIDHLVRDAIDMHMHPGPGGLCRLDAAEAAEQAQRAGMKAIVLKSHSYTAAVAVMVSKQVTGIKVFGSVCLDYEIGGLNLNAVENAARLGAKVVWMPTFSSTNSINKMRALGLPMRGDGISLLDADGKLVPEIDPILKVIKQFDMVLASGHISPRETFALIDAAHRHGIEKIVVTHPTDTEFGEEPYTMEDLKRLAELGAILEFTLVGMLPNEFCHDPARIARTILTVGPEHCLISTDLGQPQNPLPVEGLRLLIATMLHHGLSQDQVEIMAKKNPAALLSIN